MNFIGKPLKISSDTVSSLHDSRRKEYYERGISSLKKQELGVLMLAGGLATRLGVFGPKGNVKLGLKLEMSLFELFASKIIALQAYIKSLFDKTKKISPNITIPWIILTSTETHDTIIAHFDEFEYFGLEKEQIFFITQQNEICRDLSGKILYQEPSIPRVSPNGNGGVFCAMRDFKVFEKLSDRGYSNLKYIQFVPVDNLLSLPCYIEALGMARINSSYFINICTKRSDPKESVGYCALKKLSTSSDAMHVKKALSYGGSTISPCIIEYIHVSERLKTMKSVIDFPWANLCLHLVSVDFLKSIFSISHRLCARSPSHDFLHGGSILHFHTSTKIIPFFDTVQQRYVTPTSPNGTKSEMFLFDILQVIDTDKYGILEVSREDSFAPVKVRDNIENSLTMLDKFHHKLADQSGIKLEKGQQFNPCSVYDLDDLLRQKETSRRFEIIE
ncbi:putative multi-domain containing protein [Aduncisulcus paluster]|uniref:UDP-N-acetylglucosamine diphosphorylase n=1 Tax=Aduncisulcus paluster TaxID=2918883 RepID=A0ABQ5KKK3_9EUKA|nr:putative multi-domain containing protein [Aduncisulcus paluster]